MIIQYEILINVTETTDTNIDDFALDEWNMWHSICSIRLRIITFWSVLIEEV